MAAQQLFSAAKPDEPAEPAQRAEPAEPARAVLKIESPAIFFTTVMYIVQE